MYIVFTHDRTKESLRDNVIVIDTFETIEKILLRYKNLNYFAKGQYFITLQDGKHLSVIDDSKNYKLIQNQLMKIILHEKIEAAS